MTAWKNLEELGYGPVRSGVVPDSRLLENLKDLRGLRIPPDYAEFLRHFPLTGDFPGGGVSINELSESKRTRSGRLPIDVLFASDPGNSYDLVENNKYEELFPEMIWIGADIFGNRFYLSNSGSNAGVFWFDFGSSASEDSLIIVADSFSSFIDGLSRDREFL